MFDILTANSSDSRAVIRAIGWSAWRMSSASASPAASPKPATADPAGWGGMAP